ncbi:MAG TPA: hypothetical protein VK932_06975 [Kofleriaceae bacterium]|nr:hypothetical protein [Kofleriaceae bacterium]
MIARRSGSFDVAGEGADGGAAFGAPGVRGSDVAARAESKIKSPVTLTAAPAAPTPSRGGPPITHGTGCSQTREKLASAPPVTAAPATARAVPPAYPIRFVRGVHAPASNDTLTTIDAIAIIRMAGLRSTARASR